MNLKKSNKENDVYVLNIDFNDGTSDSPAYIPADTPDCKKQVSDAVSYFQQKYKNTGIVSVSLADDIYAAGVAKTESIRVWEKYRKKMFDFDESNEKDRLLKQILDLGVSTSVIEALREDWSLEDNEKLLLKYIDLYITDSKENELTKKALVISKKAHKGDVQKRPQDEEGADFIPYVNHPIQVAIMALKDLKLKPRAIQAALLHDVVEDTSVTFEDLAKDFSPETIEILHDVSRGKDENREAFMERMHKLTGVSKLIKCIDRLHNILRSFTIKDVQYLERYIKESKEVYLPEFLENPALSELAVFFNQLLEELEKFKERIKKY